VSILFNIKFNTFDDSPHRILSTWLYQFWVFSFKTAKHWGRGPRNWTASILRFNEFPELTTVSAPDTPGTNTDTPPNQATWGNDAMNDDIPGDALQRPSSLCRWSIHWEDSEVDSIRSQSPDNIDLDDEESWIKWPTRWYSTQFAEKLRYGLESNDFSNVKVNDLPIAVTQIFRAVQRSPNELLEEAFGFSIISGNIELVVDLLDKIEVTNLDISGLYPIHLATSYLNGSKTCCNVLGEIVLRLLDQNSVCKLYVNNLGHTILDNLMIAILKAHTSCLPVIVDDIFKREKRFAGEEVDICGRWDADSDCVRALFANGNPAIPFEWKHMFCHTSVQTICHCIGAIFALDWAPDINTPSGLFLKRCSHCGLKLQLLPLHTMILTAFHLARRGCKGETLFGILACLLCLLSYGANPLLKAHISLQALLGNEQAEECGHEELDPVELAEKIPASFVSTWSTDVRIGWQVFCHVLRASQVEWKPRSSRRRSGLEAEEYGDEFDTFIEYSDDEMSIDEEMGADANLPAECTEFEFHVNFFGRKKDLATLWAAVQTELLTYRRLEEGDGWTSQNFNMHALLESLNAGRGFSIGLVERKMMNPFCDCGTFLGVKDDVCTLAEEASVSDFSNLEHGENLNRLTYIEYPAARMEKWYG
jgi:hypothetical protein